MDRKTGLSEILKETLDKVHLSKEEAKSIVEKNGFVFVGSGSESLVIHPKLKRAWWQVRSPSEKPTTVLAIEAFGSHYSETGAICVFYNQKIMSTLFPHNFPRFSKSWSGHEVYIDEQVKKISGTERTYVNVIETNQETGWRGLLS